MPRLPGAVGLGLGWESEKRKKKRRMGVVFPTASAGVGEPQNGIDTVEVHTENIGQKTTYRPSFCFNRESYARPGRTELHEN